MKYFYTYVLKSILDNHYYIGWTDNLIHRFKLHQDGELNQQNLEPFELVYYEACIIEKNAIEREKQLKQDLEENILGIELIDCRCGEIGEHVRFQVHVCRKGLGVRVSP